MSWPLRSSIKKETVAIHQPEIARIGGMVLCETTCEGCSGEHVVYKCLTWKRKVDINLLLVVPTSEVGVQVCLLEPCK